MPKKLKIFIYVDPDIWEAFKNYVFQKYGTLHSYLGDELSRAIDEYLTHSRPAHSQALEHILSKPNKRHLQLLIWLLKTYPHETLYSEVKRYIQDSFGSDNRTVKKYLHDFLFSSGFVKIKKTVRQGTDHILIVEGEKIYRYLTRHVSEKELNESGICIDVLKESDEEKEVNWVEAYALERYEFGDSVVEITDKLKDFGLELTKKAALSVLRKARRDSYALR